MSVQMIRITTLIFFIFTLTSCIDDISLTQKKNTGTIKEVKNVTYFISKSGDLYEKVKGIFVESIFVSKKEMNTIKTYDLNNIANLPYKVKSKLKYIDDKLYNYIKIEPEFIYAKTELKKFNKNENKADIQDDYSNNKCRMFLNHAKFQENTDQEYLILKPLKDFSSKCKNIELFKQDYKRAKTLIQKISKYNFYLAELITLNFFDNLKPLNYLNLNYLNDDFIIHSVKLKNNYTQITSRKSNYIGFSYQINKKISFKKFLNINKMSPSWNSNSIYYKEYKEKILKLKVEIEELSNEVFHPKKLLNEDLIKDPTIKKEIRKDL